MRIIESPECGLGKQGAETPIYLFCQCPVTSEFWEKLERCPSPYLTQFRPAFFYCLKAWGGL